MNVFNQIADHYDSPKQLKLANSIVEEIKKELIEMDVSEKTALDYGCGTGLIGLPLATYFRSMVLVDPAEEMTRIVSQKIKGMALENTQVIADYFTAKKRLTVKADVIIVSLVLLHVPDTQKLLQDLYDQLKPKGTIFIVDFDKNEKIYQEKVHNGFLQTDLKRQMETIGFHSPVSRTFYHGEKIFMNQDASLFILYADK